MHGPSAYKCPVLAVWYFKNPSYTVIFGNYYDFWAKVKSVILCRRQVLVKRESLKAFLTFRWFFDERKTVIWSLCLYKRAKRHNNEPDDLEKYPFIPSFRRNDEQNKERYVLLGKKKDYHDKLYMLYTKKNSQSGFSFSYRNQKLFYGFWILVQINQIRSKKGWTIKRLQSVNSPLGMFSKYYRPSRFNVSK